ncbi:MAG: pyrroline-5-carboxylate reductase [Flavobacteriales bacterium]|nr:pyrroline-5-carboxylate reductase [Flavobacteriales bacterium]
MAKTNNTKITILGGGNLGAALARGLVASRKHKANQITITRRNLKKLDTLKTEGFGVSASNTEAIKNADVIVLAILPQQIQAVLKDIGNSVDVKNQLIISLVTGAKNEAIAEHMPAKARIIRVMPNTAIAIRESMTCICITNASKVDIKITKDLFDLVGETMLLEEEYIRSATALCSCGVAFFLRAIRAAAQGGTEIGFHASDAIRMAAQTAKGSAALLLERGRHPETEIDGVTSPQGCTIAGLNEMEHQGLSSSIIKGIKTSYEKADNLYPDE